MKNVNEFFTYPAGSQSAEAIESKQSYNCRFPCYVSRCPQSTAQQNCRQIGVPQCI